jgi:hypothetical protein
MGDAQHDGCSNSLQSHYLKAAADQLSAFPHTQQTQRPWAAPFRFPNSSSVVLNSKQNFVIIVLE